MGDTTYIEDDPIAVTPEAVISPPPIQPPSSPQNKRFSTRVVIGILLSLLLVCSGAYAYLVFKSVQNKSTQIVKQNTSPNVPQAKNPVPTKTSIDNSFQEEILTDAQKKDIVDAHNALGFDLFKSFSQNIRSNVNFSPASIAIALSQMYIGADKNTQTQIQKVLHYDNFTKPVVNGGVKYLLDSFGSNPLTKNGGFTLKVADSLWLSKKTGNVNPDYSNALRKYYLSEPFVEDFDNPATAGKINTWVSDQTNKKINEIIAQTDSSLPFILINTVYFESSWTKKFEKINTKKRSFSPLGKTAKNVSMMYNGIISGYYETQDFQSIELTYGDGDASMYVFLPKKTLNSFLSTLTSDNYNAWTDKIRNGDAAYVNLYFPSFTFEYTPGKALVDSLKNLGMTDAFSQNQANFSQITTPLYIGDIVHKTMIDLDEDGTVAAAATAIIPVGGGGDPNIKTYTMNVNRPFVYIIRHSKTGEILFMGIVTDPQP